MLTLRGGRGKGIFKPSKTNPSIPQVTPEKGGGHHCNRGLDMVGKGC